VSERESYWDAIKGVAIIAVITIHCCVVKGLDLDEFAMVLVVGWRQIVNFAVPLFLAVSGYLAGRSGALKNWDWITKRVFVLLPAYVIWTIIHILLFHRSDILDPIRILKDFVIGTGIGIGYFVVVLVQMICITPIIDKISKTSQHAMAIICITTIGLSFTYFIQLHKLEPFNVFPLSAIFFPVWYPFYHFGFFSGKSGWVAPHRIAVGLTVAALGLSFAEGYAWIPILPEFAISQTKASSLAYSFCLTLSIFSLYKVVRLQNAKYLAWIGKSSYFIYLFHLIPIIILRKAMQNVHILPVGKIAIIAICAIFASIGAAYAGRRFIPIRMQRWIMG
jgi:fucose 4-O-acetylase-like acetyltransferase